MLNPGVSCGIVPRQQKAQALGPEVKAVGHVDDHGNFVRDAVERLGRDQHAAHRLDRQIDAGHRGNLAAQAPAALTTMRVLTGPRVVSTAGDAGPVAMDRRDFGRAPNVAPCSQAVVVKPTITL